MTWQKLGLIHKPPQNFWWGSTYASVPCPLVMNNSFVRVYYATRCSYNKSRITFADFDINDPTKLIYQHNEISLDVGTTGTFDEHGVQPTKVIKINGEYIMYYAGYRNSAEGYYDLFSGWARSKDGVTFQKQSNLPFLDRTETELNIRVAAVVEENKTDDYTLLYIAGTGWFDEHGKKCPKYKMMLGNSKYFYKFDDVKCVMEPDQNKEEIGFSRPWVSGDKVYFAVRKYEQNNIPYTHIEAADFKNNEIIRTGEIVLARSKDSPESGMVCFPAVLDLPDCKYMWYNGNGYGRAGLLLAKQT